MYFDKPEWSIQVADEPKVYGSIVENTVMVLDYEDREMYGAYIQVPYAFHTFLRQVYPKAVKAQFYLRLPSGRRGEPGCFGFTVLIGEDTLDVDLWPVKAVPQWIKPFADGHVPFSYLL